MNDARAHQLDARTAEVLARQLHSAYINACGFGVDHPTTERACQTFYATLSEALKKDPALSLILDRGSLFVEKHPVGKRFNPRRMIDAFNEIGLESITFSAGIGERGVIALISILSRLLEYPSLAAAEAELRQRVPDAVQFNYIVYRKVTSDQKVVSSASAGEDPGESVKRTAPRMPVGRGGERVLDQLDSLFSLGELAGDPDAAAERLAASSQDDEAGRARLVGHLKRLAHEVESGSARVEGLSPEELFAAINSLRSRVKKTMSVQQDVDRIMSESGEVVSEVDELTYSTLVSLVREEYRGGSFSVARMAQIINRMLPDASDLKRLLPRLKKGLSEEGMPAQDYARLVHELSNELRGEHLVRALESGAEHVGLDVDDLVRQIQEDPTEAARLVVLAAELRQGGVGNGEQLSTAFTDYIERVSQQLALNAFSTDASLDSGTLGEQIERVQKELIGRMGESGLGAEASQALEQQLAQRMPQLRANSKLELFDRLLDGEEALSDTLILDWLQKQVEDPTELEQLRDPLCRRLEAHGYDRTRADTLVEELNVRLNGSEEPARLPASVLSVGNTALFLKHEVRGAQRYGNPFSVNKLLVEWLVPQDGGAPRKPRRSDMGGLLPELYSRIIHLARDLDLVGSLEKSQRAVPLIILPMTGEEGAMIFRQRLLDVLAEFPFRLLDGEYSLICTVTALGFDTETDSDANAFIQRLNQVHQVNRARVQRAFSQAQASPAKGSTA